MSSTRLAPRPAETASASSPGPAPTMSVGSGRSGSETTAGTGTLARLVLRLDRVRIVVWVLALTTLVGVSGASIFGAYEDEGALEQYASTVEGNASLVALSGPAVGLDTFGGRIAWEIWPFSIAVALMAVLAVGRHTRTEEETGRTELVRATVVGRHAHSASALAVSAGSSLLVGLGMVLALVGLGLPTAGSLVLAAGFAALGLVFGAVALVAAQVTEQARTATGMAGAAIGVTFVLRALGDVGNGVLSWASPFGWVQAAQPYAADRWWPLGLCLVATAVLVAVALTLEARRDLDAGLVRPRPGPAAATPSLGRPLGLAWRLQRAALLAWAIGVGLGGLAFGSVAASADDLVGDNAAIQAYLAQMGGASLAEVFLATVLLYLALLTTGFALQAALRPRSEEAAGRAEWVVAGGVSRTRWFGSHLVIALAGTVVVLVAGGLGTGVSYGLAVGDAGQVPRLALAALAFVPAVALVVGVAVALYGLVPRAAPAVWGLLALSVFVGVLGEGLDLPQWLRDLSPFEHVPAVPAVGLDLVPLVVLGGLAVVLLAVGLAGFRHRDLI